jgi:hypothetical protein
MTSCAKCGRPGEFYDDICDAHGTEASKFLFHLCETCQHDYYLLTKRFLEGKE